MNERFTSKSKVCNEMRLKKKDFFSSIISHLDNGDVLKTFYELGAGSTPSVVTVCSNCVSLIDIHQYSF